MFSFGMEGPRRTKRKEKIKRCWRKKKKLNRKIHPFRSNEIYLTIPPPSKCLDLLGLLLGN